MSIGPAVAGIAATDAVSRVEVRARRRFLRALLGNRKAMAGAIILLLIAFVAAFPGLIAPDDPHAIGFASNAGPSSAHLLGHNADRSGRLLAAHLEHAADASDHAARHADRDVHLDDRRDHRPPTWEG